jgi:ABC transporter substrate binding protein
MNSRLTELHAAIQPGESATATHWPVSSEARRSAGFRSGLCSVQGPFSTDPPGRQIASMSGVPQKVTCPSAELVALAPDVVVANTTPVTRALRQATSSIPIVMAGVNDPVEQGFVSSLAHPGGNITGLTFIDLLGQSKGTGPGSLVRAVLIAARIGRCGTRYRFPSSYSCRGQ